MDFMIENDGTENENINLFYVSNQDQIKYKNVVQFIEEYDPEHQFIGICEGILKGKMIAKVVLVEGNIQEIVASNIPFTCPTCRKKRVWMKI